MIKKINIFLLMIIILTIFLNIKKLETFIDDKQINNINLRIKNLNNILTLIKKIKPKSVTDNTLSKNSLKFYKSCIKRPTENLSENTQKTDETPNNLLILPNGNTLKLSQFDNISVK